ncbi:hypothetical protein [Paenibacillus sp. L3-i20]|uniref:hypothetical protein n=1 Tax=Paenibacillus sp. L3-i20 TaxID=2905833 RepID=UPI001EDE7644|nr:hypothetical protein [Paenibacillus sp. L3-i20]GKU79913.1 hypothetical protein L3i20_v243100 [Paenibacillus sp. L3-i20]
MGTPQTQVRLSLYERGIAEALAEGYGYTPSAARELVVTYIAVIRRLGGYEQSSHYAELLDRANHLGQSPSQWLQRIVEIEQGEARDRGIGEEQRQYLQSRY